MSSEMTGSIAVIGFGRSGTSLTMRMLNLLGVAIGSESDLFGPNAADNARGYFEQRWMVDLNDEILATLGTTWWQPFPAAPGWEREPALEPLRRRAAQLVSEKLGGEALRGWKDPRLTLTLPLWKDVVPDQRYVICVRNPIDAIASIQRRPDPTLSVLEWGAMWLEYTARALQETAGAPRIVVFYEDYFRDARGEVERLARFLGMSPADERCAEAAATVEDDLRHHVTSPLDLASLDGVPAAARLLYLTLRATQERRAPGRDADGLAAAVERLAPELWSAGRHVDAAAQAAPQRQLEQVEAHADLLAQKLELLTQLCDERAQALDQSRQLLQARDRDVARLSDEIVRQRATVAGLEQMIGGLQQSISWRVTRPARAGKRLLRERRLS